MSNLANMIQDADRVELAEGRPCSNCGSTDHRNFIRESGWAGGHYGRVHCVVCHRFIKWAAKPLATKAKRGNIQKKLVSLHSKGFCEICLRKDSDLPLPQVLEAHHIIPVADGGSDEASNIQICCTSCHRLIHHQRTYLGHLSSNIKTPALMP